MQVTETLNDGLKRGYNIVVSAAELEEKVNGKLAEAAPEIQMKGFRKGKVPLAILKKQFGQRLLGEAMQESIDGAMSRHFEDSGDRPALQPKVEMTNEDWKEGDDIEVAMSYEALPEIPDVEYSKIKLEKLIVEADETALNEALQNLAENAQNFEDRRKGSKAKDGDQVVIDFIGKADGEVFDGGSAEDFPLVLGSGQFIPGFEDQLAGVKAGDEKSVDVTFPEEYGNTELAGKGAVFDVKVKAVQEPKPAKIDDELAKKFGADDLAALKSQVTERLETDYSDASRAVMKRGLLDALDKAVKFDLPPSLVEVEAGQIAHQLWHEENPDHKGHDHDNIEPTDEHEKLAERRVRLGLLLAEIGKNAEVEVSDAEMTQAVMNQAREYPGQERQFFEAVQKNPQLRDQIRAPLFEDKVIDHIVDQIKVTEKTVSKDALEKAVKALEED